MNSFRTDLLILFARVKVKDNVQADALFHLLFVISNGGKDKHAGLDVERRGRRRRIGGCMSEIRGG